MRWSRAAAWTSEFGNPDATEATASSPKGEITLPGDSSTTGQTRCDATRPGEQRCSPTSKEACPRSKPTSSSPESYFESHTRSQHKEPSTTKMSLSVLTANHRI